MIKLLTFTFLLITLIACNSTPYQVNNPIIDNAIENRQSIKPLLLIEAMYPKKELNEEVQGYCQVSFDLVNKEKYGSSPTNIEALDCVNSNFFAACKDALEKWRFSEVEKLNADESVLGLIYTCKFELGNA